MFIDALNDVNVFITLWCREYACSPWCYDEFDIAINKHQKGEMDLLILCLDNTRIVPKGARDLINYRVKNKKDIENEIMRFIYQKGVR